MAQDQLMSDADVFGAAAPQPTPAPPIAYLNGGHGVTVQVGGDPNWTPPTSTPQPQAPPSAQASASPAPPGLMSDQDVFGQAGPGAAPATNPAGLHSDFSLGLYQGFMKPLDNAAQGLEWLAGKVGLPTAQIDAATNGSAADAAAQHQDYIAYQAGRGLKPGFWGNLAGNVAGTLPIVAGLGPLSGGAISGALTSNAKTPQGVAIDAGIGAAGGKLADGAVNFLKGLVAPTVSDAARTLLTEGVGLTPGQIAGGALKRLEDGATSIPILGDIIKNAQARSMTDFNRAAINRSLTPIGQSLPEGLSAGHDAVDYAHQALSKAYDDLVPSLTARADPTFTHNIVSLQGLAQNLTPDYANKFNTILQNEVLGRFGSQTGVITGQSLKEAESQLGQQATRFGKLQDGHAQDYADAVRQLQAELRGLVQRQNPEVADELGNINTGWANLVRVEAAAGRQGATGGVFTPSQLQGAVRAADNSVRKSASARGGALMQDLAGAGKEVLPSSVPDSGSPYRHAMEALVALLVGQEAHALPLMLKGAAAGGVVGGAYTRAGQKVITPLMTVRPAAADQIADFLARYKAPAVPAGSAAAVALHNAGTN